MEKAAIILAGGQGKRMKSNKPKVLCNVLGEPILEWELKACEISDINNICIVKGYHGEMLDEYLEKRESASEICSVLQSERLGTGHAVMQARDYIKKFLGGDILVLNGDLPFIDKETIEASYRLHKEGGCAVTVLTAVLDDAANYGRIIRNQTGISGIVEKKDCTPQQLEIKEINAGCYWFNAADLLDALGELKNDNAQNEYYLTDCIEILISKGKKADAYASRDAVTAMGANDRKELFELNDIARKTVIDKHLENGIEFTCTDGVVIEKDVVIGKGTVIDCNVSLRSGTVIGEDCHIGSGCVLSNTKVGNGVSLNYVQAYDAVIDEKATIGPFVHIRPNSHIMNGVKIGDFVEVKNSTVGECTSVSHLTYIGDSDVGANVNFGCGVVTVNYNGKDKFRCEIEDNAFIGCNTNIVAPVHIGKGAYTAAGSTITGNVPDDALAIERGKTIIKEGYAHKKLWERTEKYEKNKKHE